MPYSLWEFGQRGYAVIPALHGLITGDRGPHNRVTRSRSSSKQLTCPIELLMGCLGVNVPAGKARRYGDCLITRKWETFHNAGELFIIGTRKLSLIRLVLVSNMCDPKLAPQESFRLICAERLTTRSPCLTLASVDRSHLVHGV